MPNKELEKNKEMVEALEHVSKSCVGSYGYLADVILWMSRSGMWLKLPGNAYRCSVCKDIVFGTDDYHNIDYKYCPYCGAIMRGV